jgi:RHS repeat-associated protein
MTNHLGNVLTVIHDIKIPLNNGTGPAVSSYRVGIRNSTDYSPFGVELDGRTVSGGYRFGYQGSEKDNEFKGEGNSYTTEFRQLDPRLGRWLSVDPKSIQREWLAPYNFAQNNTLKNIDPSGELDDEFDQNGNKISNLGGNKIDFYHLKNGDTKVVDRQSGVSNTISGGESLIRGYTRRSNDITWSGITIEWDQGSGPTNSMIADFNNTTKGPFGSLNSTFSSYSSLARESSLNSDKLKGTVKMNYGNANPIVARDMWEQMWGRTTISWYKLGDKTLFLMVDSKSMTSFGYRQLPSWERENFQLNGITRQTYIWTETSVEIETKVLKRENYFNEQLKREQLEYSNPIDPKF